MLRYINYLNVGLTLLRKNSLEILIVTKPVKNFTAFMVSRGIIKEIS